MCDEGKFISGMSAKMDPESSVDDKALTGLKIQCDYIDHSSPKHHTVDNEAAWGEWQPWSRNMKQKFVCGAQARYEEYQGMWTDDTALNGINYKLCPAKVPIESVTGFWKLYQAGSDELEVDMTI